MPFNDKSRLDTSQVQDRRGRGTGMRIAVGGGGLGILVLVVALIMGVNPSDLSALVGGDQTSSSNSNTTEISDLASESKQVQTQTPAKNAQ
jgi:predicted metalloprotease